MSSLKNKIRQNTRDLLCVLIYYGFTIYENDFKIVCPFHNDINPSLSIDTHLGRWYCFACNEGGNAFDFVKKMEAKYNKRTNELETVKLFYKIVNNKKTRSSINIPINIRSDTPSDETNNIEKATDYYYGLPTIDWNDYKLDGEQIEARHYIVNRGFNTEILNNTGCKFNYSKEYKLIFPLLDNGLFKGWVCRATEKSAETKARKYLYNKGFKRSESLIGNYNSSSPLFIVEGYLDLLKLQQFGIKNAVALLGWKLSTYQIQKIKDAKIDTIVCALDNDECGIKGYQYCKNFFKTYRFQYLKKIKDIGETDELTFIKMLKRTEEKYKIKIKE